jgi:hypothetical protein
MRSTRRSKSILAAALTAAPPLYLGLAASVPVLMPAVASACGCFAPTTVASPVVQAGEKILFAKQNGNIIMHVQVQYSGPASDFGWLLPLPAVSMNSANMPGIDVGSQEVFDALSQATQPTYSLTTIPCGGSGSSGPGFGCAADSLAGGFAAPNSDQRDAGGSPLVKQDSVGPYNYAILKADDKSQMLNWLSTNGYVVPAGTDAAVMPYIRPGGYFLALRLKKGESTGDLQPVVLRYQSDLPMVPINLTAASATPNMGILIWVLGAARAIPRNYYNTVIDDAQLDWLNSVQNYADVVGKAVREVDGHHGFVTEYAGSQAPVGNLLGTSSRFTFIDQEGLATQKDPVRFVQALLRAGGGNSVGALPAARFALNGQLTGLLSGYIPMPQALVGSVTPGEYYANIGSYLANPGQYPDIQMALANFNPAMAVQDLNTRIVVPTVAAQALFADPTLPKLTRLYTVMSPDDMNLDPVFSYNPDLPDVPASHSATLHSICPKDGYPQARLTTDSGWQVDIPGASSNTYPTLSVPYAQRIEQVMDTGMPTVKVDNSDTIQKSLAAAGAGGHGCTSVADGRRQPGAGLFGLLAMGLCLGLLRRRRVPQ